MRASTIVFVGAACSIHCYGCFMICLLHGVVDIFT